MAAAGGGCAGPGQPSGVPITSSVPGGSPAEPVWVAPNPWGAVGSGLRKHWQDKEQGEGPRRSLPQPGLEGAPSLPFPLSFILFNHKRIAAS